jgi:hypothetical protein
MEVQVAAARRRMVEAILQLAAAANLLITPSIQDRAPCVTVPNRIPSIVRIN